MENKYYTPSLEEFHQGFEYEEESISGLMYHDKIFRFNWFDLQKEIITGIDNKKIRVKYLDQEDIESLGFKRKAISRSEWSKVVNDQIFTIHEFWTYNRSERENLIRITSGKENNFPYRIKFEGDIKNKSELVKILKQLNIK